MFTFTKKLQETETKKNYLEMAATPFFSNLVLECWECDRDDSDTDVNVNRAFGIVSAPAPAAAQQPQPPQPPSSSSSSQSTQLSSASSGNSSVAREYRDLRVIGSGSFGTIYSGLEIATGERVAIKVEAADGSHNMLYNEYQVYSRHLQVVNGRVIRFDNSSHDSTHLKC